MNRKKVFSIIFSLTAAVQPVLSAAPPQQNMKLVRKSIDQAKTYIKSGKDYDKAEKLMTDLLKDTVNRTNVRIYDVWFQSVCGQYDAANEKLYLKQKYDTAAFYNLTRRIQQVAFALDSLDVRPDHKGRVRPEYRKDNAALLHALRLNIYYGGTWHVKRGDYRQAYLFFDDYLEAVRQPLFEGYDYQQKDSLLPTAAYWATLCGFKLQDAGRTLKHSQLALTDKGKRQFTLQYICEAYLLQHNDSAYEVTLLQGFDEFVEYPYFFPRLADRYNAQRRYADVLELSERGLKVSPANTLFLLAKSVALLNLERYDECVESSQALVRQNDQLPEPYFNIATCYLNEALVVEQQNEPRKNRQRLQTLYQQARPYMEKYRELSPNDKGRWAPALYRIYLNLNLGKQFDEIDRLMRNN